MLHCNFDYYLLDILIKYRYKTIKFSLNFALEVIN